MPHVRKGDTVIVIAGASKGKKGKVLRVLGDRVVVEKVAMVKRHTRPTQKNPQGGIVDKEGTVHISNVQLFDEKSIDALNVVIHLLQSPESLAYVLEAAGGVTLERCGAILDERVAADGSGGAAAG